MIDDEFERRVANAAEMAAYCRCGDHESDHIADVFVARHTEPGSRACIVPFCRCGHFTPMTAWHAFGAQEPEEAGP